MPNVFITHQMVDENYEGARRFGGTTFLAQGRVDTTPRAVSEITGLLLNGLRHSTDEDYLLFSGSSLISAIAFRLWLDIHPVCKLLLFKGRKSGEYEVVTVGREELKKAIASTFVDPQSWVL